MKRFYKALSLLLALVLCCACVMPAFAEGEPDPETCEHSWLIGVVIKPSTCVPGIQGDKCTICGATRNEVETPAVREHTLILVIDVQPTCGEAGTGHEFCTVCEQRFNENTPVEPTGNHTYQWVTDVEPLCGKAGRKHRECTVCGAWEQVGAYEPIQSTGKHVWAWETVTPSTCSANGTQREYCTVCRENGIDTFRSEGSLLPKTEHTWRDLPSDPRNREATCTREGELVKECTVCGATMAFKVEKTAHVDNNGDDKCDACGTYMGSGSGVSLKFVIDKFVAFFSAIWARIMGAFGR